MAELQYHTPDSFDRKPPNNREVVRCAEDAKRGVGAQFAVLIFAPILLSLSLTLYLFAIGAISIYSGRKCYRATMRAFQRAGHGAPEFVQTAKVKALVYFSISLLLAGTWLVPIPYLFYVNGIPIAVP